VEEDIMEALSGTPGTFRTILDLVIAMEKGEWEQVSTLAAELQIEEQSLAAEYLDAVKWAQDIYTL